MDRGGDKGREGRMEEGKDTGTGQEARSCVGGIMGGRNRRRAGSGMWGWWVGRSEDKGGEKREMDNLEGGWKDGQQEEEWGRDGMRGKDGEGGLQGASSCRTYIMGGGRVGRGGRGRM